MMKNFLFVVYIFISTEAAAQLQVSVGTGVGSFSMSSLRAFQASIKSSFPVEARITEQFPGFVIYDASVSYRFLRDQFLGFSFQFGSTGGRVHYADYSGELYADQRVQYRSLFLMVGDAVVWDHGLSLAIGFHPGLTFSNLELAGSSTIGGHHYHESNKFHSLNVTVQPNVSLNKTWKRFGGKISLAYSLDVYQGKFKVPGGDAYLVGDENEPVIANWNGIRLGIGASYIFAK